MVLKKGKRKNEEETTFEKETKKVKKKLKTQKDKDEKTENDDKQSEIWERVSFATTYLHVEEDFPRGGEEIITPLERRKLRYEAEKDDLFGKEMEMDNDELEKEEALLFSLKGEKKKKLVGEQISSKTKKTNAHDHLSLKSLVEGVLVLCAVREIHQYRLIVSLPFNLTGSVNIGNISDPLAAQFNDDSSEINVPELSNMFHVGQILSCYVLEGGEKNIQLSLNPRLVNKHLKGQNLAPNMVLSGYVQSIEDHGYIIDFGLPDKTGFLLKKNALEFIKSHDLSSLHSGQIITCCILPGANARALPVSINPSIVNSAILPNSLVLPLSSLLPGLLVTVAVKQTTPTSLLVSFLGGFEGVVNIRHLPSFDITSYPLNKKLKARMLWVDVVNKRIGLTLQREVVTGIGYRFTGMDIGSTYHGASVIYSEPKLGIILKLPNGAHGQFMKISDVKPADIIEGVVKRVTEKGIYVSIGENFNGFCPLSQLSDSRSSKTRKKLIVGTKVKCQVLKVDVTNRFILLTHKHSLVSSKLHPLTDLSSAEVGGYYDGEIVSITDRGLVVRFYNGICGFLPSLELSNNSAQVVMKPQSYFSIGQIITCQVINVDVENNKLKLSLRKDDVATPIERLTAGVIIDLEVSGVTGDGISLVHRSTGELVYMPLECLSDYIDHSSQLLSLHGQALSEATDKGERYIMKGVLVLSEASSSRPAIGTLKALLINGVKESVYPNSFSEINVGSILPGVIKKTYSYGCFVSFPNKLVGLVPLRLMSDDFLTESTGVYRDMQTVLAKVQEQDEEKEKLILSLRPSDLKLYSHCVNIDTTYDVLMKRFLSYLQEKDVILNKSISIDEGTCYTPGTVLTAEVTSISQSLIHLSLDNGATAKAYVAMATGVGVATGHHVACCVLDLQVANGVYWVSLNPKICKRKEEEEEKGMSLDKKRRLAKYHSQFKLDTGHSVTGVIEHATSHYYMCTVSTLTGSVLVYGLFDSGQWGVIPFQLRHLKPGSSVNGTVIHSSSHDGRGPPIIVMDTGIKGGVVRSVVAKQKEVSVGDIIEVKVVCVNQSSINVSCQSWKGTIHVTMLKDELKEGSFPLSEYLPGHKINARIIKFIVRAQSSVIKPKTARLELTAKPSLFDVSTEELSAAQTYTFGDKVVGVVKEVTKSYLVLDLALNVTAFIPAQFMPEKSTANVVRKLTKCYQTGQVLSCTLGDLKGVAGRSGQEYYASLIGPLPSVSTGDTVSGCVTNTSLDEGLTVSLDGYHLRGLVDLTDISDHFLTNPTQYFDVGDKLDFFVIGKTPENIQLSLRQSHIGTTPSCLPSSYQATQPDKEVTDISDLKVGDVVRGYVRSVTKSGIFVKVGRSLVGRVMIRNLSDRFVHNYQTIVSRGELVRAKVLVIDESSNQVELSLKLSDIDGSVAKEMKERKKRKRKRKLITTSANSDTSSGEEEEKEEEEESIKKDLNVMTLVEESPGKKTKNKDKLSSKKSKKRKIEEKEEEEGLSLPLPVSGGFTWDKTSLLTAGLVEREEEGKEEKEDKEEDTDDESGSNRKKTKRQKKAIKKAEELRLYQKEHSLLDQSRVPESADDFDRLLVAHPNSSSLWLQYMAYYLHTAEIDKARSIAERGLNTISFREEQEKLNLWVGLMNLENIYGSEESLGKVFQKALHQNEPLTVYYKLVNIYETSDKIDLADELYRTMIKKFRNDVNVWNKYGFFLMRHERIENARKILQQSFVCLDKKQQIEVINKFAQYEFKFGDMERGCTMYDSLLSSYPKRVDLWSVYIDMLLKKGEKDRVRDVFERSLSLKLSGKKSDFLCKRYIEFDKF